MRPTIKLGKICKIQNGYAFDSKKFNESRGFPLIRIRNIKPNKTDTLFDGDYSEEFLVHNGDFLIGMDGEFNHTLRRGGEALLNQRVCRLYDYNGVLKEYIYYIIGKKLKEIEGDTVAVTVKHISSKQILDIEIPLPPLETQKAIVAKLDQIFAELDQTKSEIQKNLDNADELWKSDLNQAFQGDWEMKKIKDIADIKSGKRLPKGNFVQDKKTDYPYIRVSDFGDDGTITVSTVKYITEEIHEQIKKYIITDKDLYVSIAGTIGKTGIIPSEFNGANLTENAVRLVYNGKYEIDNRFILYFTNSKSFEVQAGLASRAVAMPKLAISRLENIELPVPPLSEQEKIVEHLDQVSKEVKALKSQYQSQLDNLEELKKSVLDKAFKGEIE